METTIEKVINPNTAMGPVTLRVGNLDNTSAYYEQALSLTPIEEKATGKEIKRVLGRAGKPLLRLIGTPDLPSSDPSQAGLYHTAFLFETPEDLSATVYAAAQNPLSRFVGSSDHAVSEAFYFTDPEGNGIELYTDRPRMLWPTQDGKIQMTTNWLDPNLYLEQHLTEKAVQTATNTAGTVGHVHLQVGDIPNARKFYVDSLGFEVTQDNYPGALFVSAGGYHHHLAMNTWNSRQAGPRAASLGLGNVSISVPGRDDLDQLINRLQNQKIAYRDNGASITVTDPWNTQVTIGLPNIDTEQLLDN